MANLINPNFFNEMNEQLQKNAHKGEWTKWSPVPDQIIGQLSKCQHELEEAILTGDKEMVQKHAVDLANFAEKAYCTFGF